MTLRQKIGQLIFTGFQAGKIDEDFMRLVEEYKVGNVILFSRNIENAHQVRTLNIELQKLIREQTGYPAFISIDQEGGMVTRLTQDCTNMPGAMAVAATGNPDNARIIGEITGRELHALGINVNLAPVMDVNSNPSNPVIGVRSYGDTPDAVSSYGIEMMRGLNSSGVMSVLKHFPGHGDTSVDSHLDLPVIDKPLCELEGTDLMPFKNAVDCGAEAVMTSHILFPQIEKENYPATMSRTIITGLLKCHMGFKGLVMTDCLEMDAIKKYYGTAKGALEAIKAGVDMVFISHTAGLVREAVELIENAVMSGELPLDRLDEAVDKVLKFKSRYADYDINSTDFSVVGCQAHRTQALRISSESITLVRDNRGQLPVKSENIISIGFPAKPTTNAMNPVSNVFSFPAFMAEWLGGESLLISTVPQEKDMEHVLEAAKGKDAVLFGTYNGRLHKGQIEILNRLCMEHDNVIAVALGNPYDISEIDQKAAAIATYEYTPLSMETLAKVIRGEITPTGKISVRI
ncbi:beta-N-acetylhexosaminidase [Pseudoclostridium thermosuccinogenes]|uniref:beta-N-acetylhexosaminidase n=1 Tax=Clostridium thermosuccinogenes TaxID=84032 RepID=UPI002FDA54AA